MHNYNYNYTYAITIYNHMRTASLEIAGPGRVNYIGIDQ